MMSRVFIYVYMYIYIYICMGTSNDVYLEPQTTLKTWTSFLALGQSCLLVEFEGKGYRLSRWGQLFSRLQVARGTDQ